MSTAVQPALHPGDSLESLEQRIQQAVQLVARLRADKESALAEASAAKTEAAEAKAPAVRPAPGTVCSGGGTARRRRCGAERVPSEP